jgi:hypothetical protein
VCRIGATKLDYMDGVRASNGFDFGVPVVEVPEESADTIIKALRATNIRGQKVTVRREQEKATHSPKAVFGKSFGSKEVTRRKKRFVSV